MISRVYMECKYLLKSVSNIHRKGSKKNIFLFASPRGGSTWLMEVIASQPGIKYFDEPLNIRRDNVKRTGRFDSWAPLTPGVDDSDRIIEYFRDIERNKYPFMNPPPLRKNHHFFTDRIIFKVHEIEHLINVVRDKLDAKVVFLLRHPIATTISRRQFPRFEHFVNSASFQERYLTADQRSLVRRVVEAGSEFDRGILCWCFQNIVPLNVLDHAGWLIVTYEELVLNAERACDLLYRELDLADPKLMLKAMGTPAANISLSDSQTRKAFRERDETSRRVSLVTKWKKRVTREQEERAFQICSAFNITVYERDRFLATEDFLKFRDTRAILDDGEAVEK